MAEFFVSAEVGFEVDEASIRRTTREIQSKLASALKPVAIQITAQQSANINRSLEAMVKNLKSVEREAKAVENQFNAVGRAGAKAFRDASVAKDRFRSNLRGLNTDLTRTVATAGGLGSALQTSFRGITSRTLAVSVIPIIDTAALRTLPPVALPVIPILAELATFQPLAVPIIPILPTFNIQPLPVELEAVGEIDIPALSPVKVPIIIDETSFLSQMRRIADIAEFSGAIAADKFKTGFNEVIAGLTVNLPDFQLPNLPDISGLTARIATLREEAGALGRTLFEVENILDRLAVIEEIGEQAARTLSEKLERLLLAFKEGFINAAEFEASVRETALAMGVSAAQAENLAKALNRIPKSVGGLGPGTASVREFEGAVKSATSNAASGFSNIERAGTKAFGNLGGSVKRFVGQFIQQIGFLTTAGVGAFAGFALKAAADLETLRTALNTTFGAAAEDAFNKITAFAARTPFQIQNTTKEVVRLGNTFGFTADQALQFLSIIGNAGATIGATSEQIDNAVIALTQIQARGKLGGQELLQLANSLPNITQVRILEEVAKIMGTTAAEAQKLADDGLVPASVGIKAYLNAAKAVNPQQDAMAKQAKTLNGLFSTLKDTFNLVAEAGLRPLVKGLESMLDPLLNAEGSLESLTSKAELFGRDILFAIQDLQAAFGPAISKIFDSLKSIFADIISLVPVVVANFKNFTDVVANLSQLAAQLSGVLTPVVKAIAGIIAVITSSDTAKAVIEGIVAALLSLRVISTITPLIQSFGNALAGIGAAIVKFAADLIPAIANTNLYKNAVALSTTAQNEAKVATTGLNTAMNGLAGVIGIATIAWQVYESAVSKAKSKQDELIAAATQGLNVSTSAGTQAIQDQNKELDANNKLLDEANKKRKDTGKIGGIIPGLKDLKTPGFLKTINDFVDPQAALKNAANQAAYNEQLKKTNQLKGFIAERDRILQIVQEKTGKDQAAIIAEAQKQNLDIFHVVPLSKACNPVNSFSCHEDIFWLLEIVQVATVRYFDCFKICFLD